MHIKIKVEPGWGVVHYVKTNHLISTPNIPVDCSMQRILHNTFLESSADHHDTSHVHALVTPVLKKHSHQRSGSPEAIAPSAMDDFSSMSSNELENSTTEEPSAPDSEELVEDGDRAPLIPQSDAQRLDALVRLKMTTDEPLQGFPPSYSEGSHGERGQSPPPSPPDSPDLSIHPSDLIYINSLLAQDEALEMEAVAQLQKRPPLRSRMRKLSILNWFRKVTAKGSGR
ncbi:hypothetical protein EDB19DRAFT_1905149 [Suillus lakei]|nr:hypothetical protein EDB19DRAFT_1905149 [Suillus lakei]